MAHTESKDLPIYRLVVARQDGKLGELAPAAVDCDAARCRGAVPPIALGQRRC